MKKKVFFYVLKEIFLHLFLLNNEEKNIQKLKKGFGNIDLIFKLNKSMKLS